MADAVADPELGRAGIAVQQFLAMLLEEPEQVAGARLGSRQTFIIHR